MHEPDATRPETAAEILIPALKLWLVLELMYGVVVQLSAVLFPLENSTAYSQDGGVGWVVIWLLRDLAAAVYVIWFVRRDPDARRIFAPPRPRAVELSLFVIVVGGLVLHMWEQWLSTRLGARPEEWGGTPEGVWFPLIATALVPGVIEELAFRGLIQQRLLRVLPLGYALSVQAMLFSLMHTEWAWILPHFVFGLLAGVLRVVAGALWPCILMHVGWNALVVLDVF